MIGRRFKLPARYSLGCLIVANFLFTGCVSLGSNSVGDVSQLSPTGANKQAAQRILAYSEALHGFIAGSLYSKAGEHDKAIAYFKKTNTLMGEDVSPTVLLQLGEVLLAAGNGNEALKFIERAYTYHKDDFDVALLYGSLLHAKGDVSRALDIFSTIPLASPQALEATLIRCAIISNQGDLVKALSQLKSYISKNRSDDKGYYFLSIYQELNGLPKESAQSLKQVIKLNPTNATARMAYGRLLLKEGRGREALTEYRAVQKQIPDSPQIGAMVSLLEEGKENTEKLKDLLSEVPLVKPSLVSIRFVLAEFLLEKGKIGRSLQELYLALLEDPNFHQARYRIALIFSNLGAIHDAIREIERIPESSELYVKSRVFASVLDRQIKHTKAAEEHIKQALVKEKDNLQILLYLVGILRDSGRYGEAETVITKALETNPESASLIYDYAMLLHVMKREQEAKKLMERLIEVDGENHSALNYLAYAHTVPPIDKQKLSQALQMVNTALELDPANGYYLDTKGWVLYNLEKYHEAVDILLKATESVQQDGLVYEHLAQSFTKIKDSGRALETYRSALTAYEYQRDMGTLLDHDAIKRIKLKLRILS